MSESGCPEQFFWMPRGSVLSWGILMVTLVSGCGSGEQSINGASGPSGDGSVAQRVVDEPGSHDHVHDHGHHRPRHKPRSFDLLPGSLLRRLPEDGDVSRLSRRRMRELQEIVGWIPELAADSELKRSGFEQAVACQEDLQVVLSAIASGRDVEMRLWSESVERLRVLAESLKGVESGGQRE
ncbi:MAG: hypothetical protein RL215_2570 [Planctomycetota bacterium]